MKAFVKRERTYGAIELMEVAEPQLAPRQIKINIQATVLCGSNLHAYEYPKGDERWGNYDR